MTVPEYLGSILGDEQWYERPLSDDEITVLNGRPWLRLEWQPVNIRLEVYGGDGPRFADALLNVYLGCEDVSRKDEFATVFTALKDMDRSVPLLRLEGAALPEPQPDGTLEARLTFRARHYY